MLNMICFSVDTFYILTLQTMFGDLVLADAQYGGNKGRRWKVDWDMAPQPVQIKLKCFRGGLPNQL